MWVILDARHELFLTSLSIQLFYNNYLRGGIGSMLKRSAREKDKGNSACTLLSLYAYTHAWTTRHFVVMFCLRDVLSVCFLFCFVSEWSAEKPSHADIIIHQHYHPPPHHRHHNHHQHPHHYHHLIILINGSSRRSIIIISTIFIIITSTSSHHYHFYHQNHYRTIFTIIVVVVIVITTVWNKNMLKKRWSICHIRWDTIVILFHNLQKRSSLKKGLDFDMQKITS